MSEQKKPQTLGQTIQLLTDTMILQFRQGTQEQAEVLSVKIHTLKKAVDELCRKHDTCVDLMGTGEFGWKSEKISRIRKAREDAEKKENTALAALDF